MAERLVAAGMDMRVGVPSVIEGRQTSGREMKYGMARRKIRNYSNTF